MARRPGRDASDLLFQFCIRGTAVSWRAASKGGSPKTRLLAWQDALRKAAFRAASGCPPSAETVQVEIFEFSEARRSDRDNMAKPILDAMQGILYEDDRQVAGLHVEWYDLDGIYRIRFIPLMVASSLSRGAPFVWVRVLRHRPSVTLRR